METKKYKVSVWGCDDSTHIVLELNENDLNLIKKIAKKITKASTYGCKPTMDIKLLKQK